MEYAIGILFLIFFGIAPKCRCMEPGDTPADQLRSGATHLTDQWVVHGILYESTGINAKNWGQDHSDNLFSFKQGLIYYKLAMEVAEDIPFAAHALPEPFQAQPEPCAGRS